MMTEEYPQIVLIRMSSGEEILGSLEGQDSSTFTFKNMIQLHFMPNEDGQVGVQFMPFPLSIKENQEVTVYKNSVSTLVEEPSQDLLNIYNSKYGSGIEVVSSPGILHS